MALTIYDIAKKAKVGVGTVSRAMNNHPSIAPSTRDHILSIARKYHYHPNASAQRLARKKSKTLTVIMPFFTNYFFAEMLRGIQDKIREIDYDLILYGVNHIDQASHYLMRTLRGSNVDGILFIAMDLPEDYVERWKHYKTPVILIDRYHPDFASLTVENYKGAFAATSHLITMGHKRIAMINGNPNSLPGKDREKGFRAALQKNKIKETPMIVTPSIHTKDDGFNRDAGYEAAIEIISRPQEEFPTALFVASDVQAIGALQALRINGISVPDQMAVIGFDDIELAQHFGLSTMRQPIYEMGILGVDMMLKRLNNPEIPPVHETFEPELIIRETCGSKHRSSMTSTKSLINGNHK